VDPGAASSASELTRLLKDRSLPEAKRGYDKAATDELLGRLEQGIEATLRDHAAALERVGALERRIAEGQEREEAVTEALVVATQIKADSEREAEEVKAKRLRDAEEEAAQVHQRAAETLKEAEAQAESILDDARLKVRGFQQEIRDTEQLAIDARNRLRAFLESLLAELDPRGAELESAVDDLLARAGQVKPDLDGADAS